MQEIQVIPTATEPCHYTVEITIPAEAVDAAYAKTIRDLRRSASLPGFRPGKTPLPMLRKKYAKAIQGEVLQELVQKGFVEGVAKTDLKPASMPSLPDEKTLNPVEGQPFSFRMEFDVAPAFEMPVYTAIPLNRPTPAVDDEMVNQFIDNMRQRQATFQVVERPSAAGDMLKISYATTVPEAEQDIPETARRLVVCKETWMMLVEPDIFPGANAQIVGAAPGENRQVEITFPADYREAFLAGKTLTYTFTVHEIHSRVLPELTDELAKTMGADNLEALREQVRSYYGREIERMQRQALEGQLYEHLDKAVSCDLPPRLVEAEQMMTMRAILRERQQQGAKQEELIEKAAELRDQANRQAALRVKMRYIIERIAEAEKIAVTEAEVADYVDEFKAQSGVPANQFDRQYDVELVAVQGRQSMLAERVMARLIELATITDKAPEPHVHDEHCGHEHGEADAAAEAKPAAE